MNSTLAWRLSAIGIAVAMGAAVFVANIARVAASTTSAQMPAAWGPAALGKSRRQLIGVQLGQKEFDDAAARRALASAPLASEPFALLAAKGLAEDPRGRNGREAALLTESLRRDPRLRSARLLMLRNLAANRDLGGSFDQLDVLSRLSPGVVNQAMDSLAPMIDSPARMDQALAALAGHQSLYEPFVAALVRKTRPREVTVRLAQGLPPAILARPAVRNSVVGQLVDAQEFAMARTIWLQGNKSKASGLVFAPDFSDRRSAPPFNWQLLDTTSGYAAFGKERGLEVVYYDRSPDRLARQIVTLPPGRFQLSVEFRLRSGSADNIRLQIACYGSVQPLADVPLFSAKSGRIKSIVSFTVPGAGCNGQDLSVAGVATAKRSETEVEVLRIDIVPGGAS